MLNLFIHQVDIMDVYLKSPLNNNKFANFMKLRIGMHNFCQIQKSLLDRLLKNLYCQRQSEKLEN